MTSDKSLKSNHAMNVDGLLSDFIAQSKTGNLFTNHYPKEYQSLRVAVSFGKGNPAKIPWLAFLGKNQEVSDGIYPVYLLVKKYDILVLSYGISQTFPPQSDWRLPREAVTLLKYFDSKGLVLDNYKFSYLFKAYELSKALDWQAIRKDLDEILKYYSSMLSK